MDRAWWETHWQEVAASCRGARVSANDGMESMGVIQLKREQWPTYGNSGAAAISLAVLAGAKRVVLLGFDCQYGPNGERHWHGDHPKHLGNARLVNKWRDKFKQLADAIPKGVQVLNCTRQTALDCFELADLQDALK